MAMIINCDLKTVSSKALVKISLNEITMILSSAGTQEYW